MERFDRSRRRFAVALAALAGFVDASGYLSGNRYFVSFMSGNTTRLGVDLVTDTRAATIPLALIAGFVCGVAAGAMVAGAAGLRRKVAVLALVSALLAAGAAIHAAGHPLAALGPLVLAMGALNATFQREGEAPVGLTYMTGALVRVGQALAARLIGRAVPGPRAHAGLWLGLLAGAVFGAAAYLRIEAACLWIATGWALAMIAVARRLPPDLSPIS